MITLGKLKKLLEEVSGFASDSAIVILQDPNVEMEYEIKRVFPGNYSERGPTQINITLTELGDREEDF